MGEEKTGVNVEYIQSENFNRPLSKDVSKKLIVKFKVQNEYYTNWGPLAYTWYLMIIWTHQGREDQMREKGQTLNLEIFH